MGKHHMEHLEVPAGKRYVFVKYITRDGRRIYASEYGLKAFRILVDA